jgi:hypothetical protein
MSAEASNRNELVGQRLEAHIHKDGRKIPTIAKAMQVSRFTLRHWCKGERRISSDDLMLFCDILKLTEDDRIELLILAGYPVFYRDSLEMREATRRATQEDTEVREILSRYRDGNLDFLALVRRQQVIFQVHSAFQQRLRLFSSDPVQKQIEDYINAARSLGALIDELDSRFKHLDQGRLLRTIFDVQRGGIFFYYLLDGIYIFAATIDQTTMDDGSSDQEVQSAVKAIKKLMRLP